MDAVITNPGTPGLNTTSATVILTNAQVGDSLSINGALPGGISSVITPGAGTITVTLSGPASYANYATALRQIVFSTSGDAPNTTPRVLDVQVFDSSGASNQATATITVDDVNDAPVLSLTPAPAVTYSENAGPTAFFTTGSLSDPDLPANFASGSYTVEITANAGVGDQIVLLGSSGFSVSGSNIQFGGNTIGTIHAGTNFGTSKVTIDFMSFATPTVVNDLVEAFGFQSSSENPSTTARTVSFTFNDGGNTGSAALDSNVVTKTVNVTAINDAPVNIVPAAAQTVDTGATLTFVASNAIQISDVDVAGSNETVTLSVTTGTLTLSGLTGLNFTVGDGTGDATMTFSGSLADVNNALNGLIYTAGAVPGSVTLTIATDDQGDTGADPGLSGTATSEADTDTVQIIVSAGGTGDPALDLDANDSSTATGSNFTTTYTEGGAAVAIADTDVTITETTPGTLTSATITLVNHQAGDILSVNGTLPTGITASAYNPATGVLTLTSGTTNTPTEYQTALKQIEFSNPGDNPDTTDRTVTVVVNDGTTNSNTALTTIHINAVNDAPVLDLDANNSSTATAANFTANYMVGGTAAAIADTDVTITDVDNTTIQSATIVLTTQHASDALSISGALPGAIGATVTPGASTITVALSGSGSLADYQSALQQIVFSSADPGTTPADRTVTVAVNDGTSASNTATTTIHVAANAAPIAADDTASATEAGGVNNGTAGTNPSGNVITGAGADTDPNGPQAAITVVAVATGLEGAFGHDRNGRNRARRELRHAHAQCRRFVHLIVNNANASVQALRTSGQTLTDTFNYRIQDGLGASDASGVNATNSVATLSITIHGANDAPTAVADPVSATEAGGLANGTAGVDPTGNVLTNDTDVDSVANGETKNIVGVALGTLAGPLAGSVGTGLHGVGVNDFGTFTVQANGSYTYVVNQTNALVQGLRTSAQTLTDTFSYTMQDAAGAASTTQVTVTILGQNDNPVAGDDLGISATEAGGTNNGTAGVNPSGNCPHQ